MKKRTGKVPGPLKAMPELQTNNSLYWAAYCDLSSKYPLNGIPYSEIVAYSELSSLDKTELLVKINSIEDALNGNNSSGTDGTDTS